MATNDPRYTSVDWRRLRPWILDRDRRECQVRGPRCVGYAAEVDHVVPVAEGGEFWAVSNLRASCAPCNRGRGAEITNRRRGDWRYSTTVADYVGRF